MHGASERRRQNDGCDSHPHDLPRFGRFKAEALLHRFGMSAISKAA
jgi:hypothetical protein